MQVNLITPIYKTKIHQYKNLKSSSSITEPKTDVQSPIMFTGAGVVQKTISSQIAHEKSKLLRHCKEILSQQVPVLTEEEKTLKLIQRAHALMQKISRRDEEIKKDANFIFQNPSLNLQQKIDMVHQLQKEFTRLHKIKLKDPEEKQPAKENYDYALINKFKTAIMNDNFELAKIQEEHYSDLANIQTVEEFKEKYPSIRIPSNPKEIITQKILDTLNRKFYFDLDELFELRDADKVTHCMLRYFDEYFNRLSKQFEGKTKNDLLNMIGLDVSRKVLAQYEKLKINEDFESIPTTRKHVIAQISSADKEMLDLDYDRFVIDTIKQMYLDGKKINQIQYSEGNKTINIASIKAPEYLFERIPERIKRIIADAQKPARLQRDYQKFTAEELKSRLHYYNGTKIGNNDKIFDFIVDFDSCRFTEEDKQYIIKFLQTLDDINDTKISLQEGIETLQTNNIRPHGTAKLNEIERLEREAKIKEEQNKQLAINKLRQDFNEAINKLYEMNLSDIAETFSKYYPENSDEVSLNITQKALDRINSSLLLNDKNKIRTQILRLEIYDDYSTNSPNSDYLFNANEYSGIFVPKDKEAKIGQYLINREIAESYPSSREMFHRPKILDKIMEKFSNDKNIAAIELCKYEDYLALDKEKRQSIKNILGIFDAQNPNDKILLKEIIEKDYVNSDTNTISFDNSHTPTKTIASNVKKEILNKYKFPNCIALFEAFENALTMIASERGKAGIKKTGAKNSSLEHKMEIKIMGYPDRLFSSKNDYYFDIYSEKGLH